MKLQIVTAMWRGKCVERRRASRMIQRRFFTGSLVVTVVTVGVIEWMGRSF